MNQNNNLIFNLIDLEKEFTDSVKQFIDFTQLVCFPKLECKKLALIKRLFEFILNEFEQFSTLQQIKQILKRLGFKREMKIFGRVFLEQIQLASLKLFLKSKSFDFASLTPEAKAVDFTTRFASGVRATNTKDFYESEVFEVDEYVKYSLIAYKLCEKNFEQNSSIQKIQIQYLLKYLVNSSNSIKEFLLKHVHSKVYNGSKNLYIDYLQEIINKNIRLFQSLYTKFIPIKPSLVELNGKAGVGKTQVVHSYEKLCMFLFPFITQDKMLYTRVNEKFWNGYSQNPIVLFDDSNQTKRLMFDLDNEIISVGSGTSFIVPMAFEKDMKFNSLFVFFTTNKKLMLTTKANKGAIKRRITTYCVEPKKDVGRYIGKKKNKHWIYDSTIIPTPFNVLFDKDNSYIDVLMTSIRDITGNNINSFYKKYNITLENILDFETSKHFELKFDIDKHQKYLEIKGNTSLACIEFSLSNIEEPLISNNQLNVIVRNFLSNKISFI